MNRQYLRNIADIQTGPFGIQLHKEDYVNDGTPIVTVEHLGNRVFTKQNLPKVSDEDKVRLAKYVLSKGDIVFSRVGSVDRCSYVSEQGKLTKINTYKSAPGAGPRHIAFHPTQKIAYLMNELNSTIDVLI